MRHMRFASLFMFGLFSIAICSAPAFAEVRFGHNVHIGGHDFSNQTFDRNHRAKIYLYDRPPRHAGCTRQSDGRGGEVKVCHLQNLHQH